MKLAWLCYYTDSDAVEIKFKEPSWGFYDKVVPIVYAELHDNN